MGKRIITVSRQFGSGGRVIAKRIAECLGYPYYDRDLVRQIALEGGLAESFVLESGEYACSSSEFLFNLEINVASPFSNHLPLSDQLYLVQYKVIRQIAEEGPCVILGRCSDYVLRDRDDCLHTFFHADTAFRIGRITNLYREDKCEPEKRLKETDRKRETYYNHYTGGKWGAAQNYHVSLDSGALGIERCAGIVIDLASNA
ncbi:MAG: cytidylate kinase-like family protein [Planctomycetota bacterium]|jgi:cytidylate kinase|nr:cytidylate kinase-like family protein [Planctomycetota bacterium]